MSSSYKLIMDGFEWSYSRIKCFEDCPYKFFLKYFCDIKEEPLFYATYGSFVHKLIENYYRGILSKDEMATEFLTKFSSSVKGIRPKESTVMKYIKSGVEYFTSFQPFKYSVIEVEKQIKFTIGDLNFIGCIDYLGEKDGELYIIDNKSRDLKPRSKRKKPTVKDKELDSMLKQLYIYSSAIKQEYGRFPKALCFNCFKSNTFIEEPFNEEVYNETIKWAKKTISDIKLTDEFPPNKDFFFCHYICGMNENCIYNQIERDAKRR